MTQVLAQCADQLHRVMVQLRDKQEKEIADYLERFFRDSLLKAVEEEDETEALRVLLQLRQDPNVKYPCTLDSKQATKATPLYIASQLGHTEAVRVLLQHNADPNLPSDDKRTPLMIASSSNHPAVVELLLAHDKEAKDEARDNALRYATDRNNVEIMKLLLEAGLDPNIQAGENGWTCLLVACCDNYPEIVSLLLKHGADPYLVEKHKKNCLMMAAQNGHTEIVSMLLNSEHVDIHRIINKLTEQKWTALALAYDHPEVVELLLDHGADPNIATDDGWTPLMLACQRKGVPATVEVLLKYKPNLDHENNLGMSAYGLARWNNLNEIMTILEKAGARKRLLVGDVTKSVVQLKPLWSIAKKFGYMYRKESKSSPVTGKSSEPAKAQPVVSTESLKPGEHEPITKEGPSHAGLVEAQQSAELEKLREELFNRAVELQKLREDLTNKTARLEELEEEVTDRAAEFEKTKEELSNGIIAELQKTREELTNRVKEKNVLQLKFTDFERDMKSFEEIITSKQQPTTEEVEMKGKFVELKRKMRHVQELLVSEEEGHEPGEPSSLQVSSDDIVRAYDDSLRASQKREQVLKEKLDTAEQDSQEKDHKYSKQEIEMQKKMATVTDEYKQQQELLEKLQHKAAALSAELEKMHNNKATEAKVLKVKFMDFEREMQSFEEIITSKQQLSTTEVEMKEKLADLKDKMRDVQELLPFDEGIEPGKPSSLQRLTSDDVIRAYDDSLRASQKREQELKEKLNTAEQDSQEKDQKYSRLENDMFGMEKKMATVTDEYKQQQELLEKLQEKVVLSSKLGVDEGVQVDNLSDMIHEYKAMLVASEEEKQVLTRMGYARDAQIAELENDSQLMHEKSVKSRSIEAIVQTSTSTVETAVQANYLAIAPDFLRGVEVFRETVLEIVGGKPQKVEWPGYGFFIEVPEGAVPPGVTASVGVKVILAGKFKFPDNSQLISAIYWVSSSIVFLEKVAVNIQHCAVVRSEDQCSQFRFIIAKCSQKELPYTFCEREGLFNSHTQYGAIKLKQFSMLAQTAPDSTDTRIRYTGFMFYKQQIASPLTVDFHFVVIKDHQTNIKKVQEEYVKWSKDSVTIEVCIDDDSSPVIILDQREQEVDQWKIRPISSPPQITKDAIKDYQLDRRIPHCGFELHLLSDKSPYSQRLWHKVDLKGITSPDNFHIRYPQSDASLVTQATQTLAVPQPQVPEQASAVSQALPSIYSQAPTTADLMTRVAKKVAPTKWFEIGVLLHIETSTLETIETQTTDPFRLCMKVLDHWKREAKVPYTWETIIKTLEAVDENDTATNIK